MKNITVFLMSAGYGTRMEELCRFKPKPLLELAGKPILEHWLNHLSKFDFISNVIINTHYLHKQFKKFVEQTENNFDFKIDLTYEEKLLGTAKTVLVNKDLIQANDFIIIYPDNFAQIDFNKMLYFHLTNEADVTLYVKTGLNEDICYRAGLIEFDKNYRITKFIEKPTKLFSNTISCGILICNESLLRLTENDNLSIALQKNINEINCFAYIDDNEIVDIGVKNDYLKTIQRIKKGERTPFTQT